MAELIAESEGTVLNGTDAASPMGKPAVEVVLDARGGDAPKSVQPGGAERARPLVAVLARLRAQEEGGEAAPAAADVPAEGAPDDEADPDAAPAAVDPDAAPDPDAEPDAEPAPTPEAPDVAALRAEAEAAKAEAIAARQRLQTLERGDVSEDERLAYIDDPMSVIRQAIARYVGVSADHDQVAKELAHIQRELTIQHIGDTNLPEDRREQRAREQSDRRWRLDQQARATARQTTQEREQRTQAVSYVASFFEAGKADFADAKLVAEVDGLNPAEFAYTIIPEAVQKGLIRQDAPPEEIAREALRLTNQVFKSRAAKIRASHTAPAQAPAPATAAAKNGQPGAPAAKSVAPAKPGQQSPRTLSAKQAAAAPVARAPGQNPRRTIVEIDPNDRDARTRRAREIAERRFAKPQK